MSVDDHRHKIFESRCRRKKKTNKTQINNMISDITFIQTLRECLEKEQHQSQNQSREIPKTIVTWRGNTKRCRSFIYCRFQVEWNWIKGTLLSRLKVEKFVNEVEWQKSKEDSWKFAKMIWIFNFFSRKAKNLDFWQIK